MRTAMNFNAIQPISPEDWFNPEHQCFHLLSQKLSLSLCENAVIYLTAIRCAPHLVRIKNFKFVSTQTNDFKLNILNP